MIDLPDVAFVIAMSVHCLTYVIQRYAALQSGRRVNDVRG
jgi:hypothetical protein